LFHVHPYFASLSISQWILEAPEPVPSLELAWSEKERAEQMGAETSVVNKKYERYPMTQEQKRRPETPRRRKKAKEKALEKSLYAYGIKDR